MDTSVSGAPWLGAEERKVDDGEVGGTMDLREQGGMDGWRDGREWERGKGGGGRTRQRETESLHVCEREEKDDGE